LAAGRNSSLPGELELLVVRKVLALTSLMSVLLLTSAGFGQQGGAALAQTADISSPDSEVDSAPDGGSSFVGPTQILFADADTVFVLRSREWWSGNVRQQEKLLLHDLRMKYWLAHIPSDMRAVFDRLGYPTGRVMLTPVGHTEEWWYYGQLSEPLRFRDGELLDWDRFERQQSTR